MSNSIFKVGEPKYLSGKIGNLYLASSICESSGVMTISRSTSMSLPRCHRSLNYLQNVVSTNQSNQYKIHNTVSGVVRSTSECACDLPDISLH